MNAARQRVEQWMLEAGALTAHDLAAMVREGRAMKWDTHVRRGRREYSGSTRLVVPGVFEFGVSWSLIGRSWSCAWHVWSVDPQEFEPYRCLARGTADSIEDARRSALAVAVDAGLLTAHDLAEIAAG